MKSHKSVLVIGMNGVGLMPTTPRKARKLLEAKKVKVYRRTPFPLGDVTVLSHNNNWICYTI